MVVLSLPAAFQRSYAHFPDYPENTLLNGPGMYNSTLQSLKRRLDDIEDDLCLSDSERDLGQFEVPIRDLRADANNGVDVDKENLLNPTRLSNWLGAHMTSVEKSNVIASKQDPMCRFVYLHGDTSRDRLKITRSSLTELFSYHQVMPAYLDFLSVFGLQDDAKDTKYASFRTLNLMKPSARALAIPSLGRSGRQFQLCYNLKCVAMKPRSGKGIEHCEWSIRQSAFHHQFDVVHGTTLWIVTSGRKDLQERFKYMTSAKGREEERSFATIHESFRSSLAAHLLFCHWATEDWRGYILWLEQVVDKESLMAIYGLRGRQDARRKYKSRDIQELQYWLDKTNEAIIVLRTNRDIVISLQKFYQGLCTAVDFPDELKLRNEDDIASFSGSLDELISDFDFQIERAGALADTIRERKSLILQHLQSQAAERTEQLNINLEREALGMRIITIVTLLYLPATFVSTFFSTDVIKYQRQDDEALGEGSFSSEAVKRWLQVTLPLTFLTLLLAWVIYKIETIKKRPKVGDAQDEELSEEPSVQKNHRSLTDMLSIKGFDARSWIRTQPFPSPTMSSSFV